MMFFPVSFAFAEVCPAKPPTCSSGQVLYYVPDGGTCINLQMKCQAAPASAKKAPAPAKTTPTPAPAPAKPSAPKPSVTVPKTPAPPDSNTTQVRTLSRGMSGSDVLVLQKFLVAQGLLSSDSATGFFGALTEAAVKKFQSSRGIASSGTPATTGYGAVGPKTRAIIATSGGAKVAIVTSTTFVYPSSGGGGSGSSGGGSVVVSGSGGGGGSSGTGTGSVPQTPSTPPPPTPGTPSTPNPPAPDPNPPGPKPCTIETAFIDDCVLQ